MSFKNYVLTQTKLCFNHQGKFDMSTLQIDECSSHWNPLSLCNLHDLEAPLYFLLPESQLTVIQSVATSLVTLVQLSFKINI